MLDVQPTIDSVASFWQNLGWKVEVRGSQRAGHARELAQQARAAGHELVVVAGGDGTIGEVASALEGSDLVLAPLPSGTGNSFAKELSLPLRNVIGKRDLIRACESLAAGRVHAIDLGACNHDKTWLLWTGIGVDGHIISRIEPRSRRLRRMGSVGYYALGLRALRDFRPMSATISIDDVVYEGDYVLVIISNCRLYAGGKIMLHDDAVLDDGLFEISLFEGTRSSDVLRYATEVILGRIQNNPKVKVVKGTRIEVVTNSPAPIHHDGDPAGETPIVCTVLPRALRLLVPDSAPPGLVSGPAITPWP